MINNYKSVSLSMILSGIYEIEKYRVPRKNIFILMAEKYFKDLSEEINRYLVTQTEEEGDYIMGVRIYHDKHIPGIFVVDTLRGEILRL